MFRTMEMATPHPTTPQPPVHQSSSPNLRNPLPLSASQEAEVKSLYYRNVRLKCAAEIKSFAECARGRTVTATWLCRSQRLAMNGCMIAHVSREEEDKAREEWFNGRLQRREELERDKIKVEERRREVVEMTRRREELERREEEEKNKKKKKRVEKDKKSAGWWG